MTVINTNVAATLTANALTKNERAMNQAMERLSTGQRINSAGDDAAGLAISSKMTSQVNGLNQAVRNVNDAISMVQTADGAVVEIESMLQRMRELAVQARSETNGATDRDALELEFVALEDGIDAIAQNTQWNGVTLLNTDSGKTVVFQVGANANQELTVIFQDFNTAAASSSGGIFEGLDQSALGGTAATDLDSATLNTTAGAEAAIARLDFAIEHVNSHRATLGSVISRLEYSADNLSNVSQNTSASRSRVLDADYATETTELARTQIIQQAGTAMLSQANQQAQSVLALLK
jgi:flagellin